MEALMDYLSNLNWVAVLVASIAGFAVGAIWYSQAVMGKAWMKAAGIKQKDVKNADMAKPMIIGFTTVLVTAIALGVLVQPLALVTALQGATFGILIGLAFISTNKLMGNLFEQRNPSLFWINLGGDVLSLAVMGAILAVWR